MHLNRNHTTHYLILFGIILLGFALLTFFSASKSMQLAACFFVAIVYLCYGLLHHWLEHDLTIKIVVEYVLVALLVAALFVLIRGGL